MVGAEIIAGFQGFSALLNGAKALKDMNDAAVRNAAVIELQGQILAAQEQQAVLVEQARQLEQKVRSFETWDAEKQRYELKAIGNGATAYMLKPNARGTEPPHWLCPNCYGQRKLGYFQPFGDMGRDHIFKCGGCQGVLRTSSREPRWL